MTPLAVLLGAGVGFGAFLVITSLMPGSASPGTSDGDRGGPVTLTGAAGRWAGLGRQAVLAAAGALLLGLATRWPVAAISGAVLGWFFVDLAGQKGARDAALERSEAVAGWAEMLRDTLAGAHGLEQAIATTAAVAPTAIRDDLLLLTARLPSEPLPSTLRRLADELADPTADLVVAALIIAAEGSSRDLGVLLGSLAEAARDEAAMRRRVEATRARARTTVQIVTGLTVLLAAGLLAFSGGYLDPYGDPLGQAVLAFIAGLFGTSLWWLARMARYQAPERLLAPAPSASGATR